MPTRTADQAYRARLTEARWLVSRIEAALEDHARRQAEQPANWGFPGDLGYACERLSEVAAILGAQDLAPRQPASEA